MEDKSQIPILISICVLSYNHEKFIEKCLRSIFSQSIIDQCEIIIADDASKDITAKIIEHCLVLCPCKFKFIPRKENIGPKKNYFDTISRTSAPYIAYIDGDDSWIDDKKLEKQIKMFNSRDDIGIVGCLSRKSSSKSQDSIIYKDKFEDLTTEALIYSNKICNSSIMFKSEAFFWARKELDVKIPEWQYFVAEDYCMWLMISSKFNIINMNFFGVDINVAQNTLSRPQDVRAQVSYLESVLKMKIMFLDYYNVPLISINRWTTVIRMALILLIKKIQIFFAGKR